MTEPRQVLLQLICYASDRGKPAVLEVRPEEISELCQRGFIEQREGGYWITDLGRGHCLRTDSSAQQPLDMVEKFLPVDFARHAENCSPRYVVALKKILDVRVRDTF